MDVFGEMKCLELVVCYVCLLSCCCGETDPVRRQHQQLKQLLLSNYSKTVSPYGDTTRINVTASFALSAILAVEETSQIFRMSGVLDLAWSDSWLTWNDSNDVMMLTFTKKEIWTPNLIIPNGVGNKIASILSTSMTIDVTSSGEVLMLLFGEFETICDIDVKWYPYDEQVCHMSVLCLNEANLDPGDHDSGTIFSQYFTGSSEWELVNSTTNLKYIHTELYTVSYVDFEFRLRRHSIFYTLSVIFPMCLLSLLNACVFLLPAASGEKVSFLVSIFVSEAVFLNYINDAIPKSGNASRLIIYLVLLLSQSALALLATLLVMNTHHRKGPLIYLLRKIKVSPATAGTEATGFQEDELVDKLDNILFVVFVAIAIASLLLCYV
ncbi:neuronal acetylcholine receptor subunit alpha-2-like [Haliotis cracherodii]|uniref:neuronal acetylcholine receptor subunit alpha-2-like n=1 Tax=Haliotis cracherodii TaxID=6455 RepID=UPI0039ED57A7